MKKLVPIIALSACLCVWPAYTDSVSEQDQMNEEDFAWLLVTRALDETVKMRARLARYYQEYGVLPKSTLDFSPDPYFWEYGKIWIDEGTIVVQFSELGTVLDNKILTTRTALASNGEDLAFICGNRTAPPDVTEIAKRITTTVPGDFLTSNCRDLPPIDSK